MNGPNDVTVRVLGSFEARVADREVPIAGAKPRALVTMLALRSGNAVPSRELADLLWGDELPRTAHKALQTYVSAVRRALGEESVRTDGEGWRLVAGSTDAAEFELLAGAARSAVDREDLGTAAKHFAAAKALWRGSPPLPETHYGDAERTRWCEMYEALVDDRVDVLLRCGHAADLVGELELAVAATPLRERRWEQLCLALYRAGRQGDALGAYRRARDTLTDELGVEPGQELRRLEAAMLAHDPAIDIRSVGHARVAAVDNDTTALPSPPTSFIGRSDELRRFEQLLNSHRLVTAVGPGGVGKTRLAVAAAQRAAAAFPDGVWFVDLASANSGYVREAVAAGLEVFVPAERSVEEMIFERLRAGRALLLLDSCEHVLDEVSGFVDRLLAVSVGLRVIVTSRERLRAAGEHVFTLRPLAMVGEAMDNAKDSDAGRLFLERVRAIDPDFDADPEHVGKVCERCDGLPLAIELAAARCASLGIDGLLAGLDDHLRLLSGATVPTARHRSLRAVLDWSHHLLDESEQVFFRRLSLFAGWFDLDSAAAVAGIGRTDVVDLVGRLTDKNLLVHTHERGVSQWKMLDVVRSYARTQLEPASDSEDVRQRYIRWAAATAAALEARLDVGEPWRETFERVNADLQSSLARMQQLPDCCDVSGSGLTLSLALARLHARSGAFTLAQAAYELAMALARATHDAKHLARAAMGASQSGMLFGVTREGRVSLLEEAIAAQGPDESGIRVRLLARLATELFWSGQRGRSLALAEESTELADRLDDDNAKAHASYARHYVTRRPDNWRERLELAELITIYGVRSGETQLELAGRAAYVVGLLEAGDLTGMAAGAESLRETANRLDHPEFQWYSDVFRLVGALVEGRFGDADALAVDARASAVSAPEFAVGLFFAEAVTDLRVRDDADTAEFDKRVAEMARQFPRVVVWRCLQVRNAAARQSMGARAEARMMTNLLLAEEVHDGHWLVGCVLMAEAAAMLRDSDLAHRLVQALLPFEDNYAVAGRVAAFRGPVSQALGHLALARGEYSHAVGYFEQAAEKARQIGARPFVERSEAGLAEARLGR